MGEINDYLKKMNLMQDTLIFFSLDDRNYAFVRDHEDGVPANKESNIQFAETWSALNQKSGNK